MNVPRRTAEIQRLLKRLSDLVAAGDDAAARSATDELGSTLGDNDPEVLRARTLLEFLADDE